MADKKISALAPATTPLAGTEVLPIVQGGSTVKVSAANITAGRTVSAANYTVETGGKISSAGDLVASVSNSANSVYFGGGGTPPAQIWLQAVDTAVVYVNGATRLTTDNVGNHTVNTGNLVVGTAGKGIDFSANANAPGMTSELLDWYETGTWTPTQGTFGTWSSPTFNARYTRIGNQVTLFLQQTTGSIDSGVAGSYIQGLPFTPAVSGSGMAVNGSIQFVSNLLIYPDGKLYFLDNTGAQGSATFTISYTV